MARSSKAFGRSTVIPAVAAFVAAAIAGPALAGTLAMGPVEQINLKSSTLVVLGQIYHVLPSTKLVGRSGATVTLESFATNSMIVVKGAETASGATSITSITSIPQMDVPGATQLSVTGVVSSESATGQIQVGNLSVDINSTLTGDAQNFGVGSLVTITGTQPNPNGLFLAQSIVPVSGVDGSGKSVTTALGVDGSGKSVTTAFGVDGSGKSMTTALGVDGSGKSVTTALGVDGSGKSVTTALGVDGSGKSMTTALGVDGSGLK